MGTYFDFEFCRSKFLSTSIRFVKMKSEKIGVFGKSGTFTVVIIYLLAFLLTYLLVYLLICLLAFLLACLITCLLACLLAYLIIYL